MSIAENCIEWWKLVIMSESKGWIEDDTPFFFGRWILKRGGGGHSLIKAITFLIRSGGLKVYIIKIKLKN